MGKLTINDIATVLVNKNGLDRREANQFVTELFAVIMERLDAGEQVKVKGLGTFRIIDVEARESVSVRTGERVVISGHSKLTFIPDATMKELVNKPFSQFETVVLNDGVEFDDMKVDTKDDTKEDDSEEESEDVEMTPDSGEKETVTEPQEVITPEPDSETVTIKNEEEVKEDVKEEETKDEVVEIVEEEVPEVEEVAEEVEVPEKEEQLEKEEQSEKKEQPEKEETPEEDEAQEEHYAMYPMEYEWYRRHRRRRRWRQGLLFSIGVLALMAASAAGGYYYGKLNVLPHDILDTIVIRDTIIVTPRDSMSVSAQDSTLVEVAKDAVTTAPKPEEQLAAKAVEKQEVKSADKAVKKKEVKPVETVDQYAAKDARVRLGAYRIVGFDHEVKVQVGQTFYGICRANLGPDMECYVEVFNNLPKNPTVKEGQVIKIPKLQLKKRNKK